MGKNILRIFLAVALMVVSQPFSAHAMDLDTDAVAQLNDEVRLVVNGQNVRVQNAQGAVLEVFSITGTKVSSVRIDSADKSFSLNLTRGCYIVKVKNIVRKVSIL